MLFLRLRIELESRDRDLVKVVDEIVEVFFVSLRRQPLSSDPLDVVLLVDAVVVLHLLGQQLVTIVTQQFYGFLENNEWLNYCLEYN